MKRFTLFLASLLCCICLNAQDYDASKVYTLQNVIQGRGYLAYHADYTPNNGLGLAGVTLGGYQSQHKQTTDDGVNINFSIYKSSKGKYYLYNLGAGKFIGINGNVATYTDTATPFTITVGKESSRQTDVCFQRADGQYLCLACGYSSTTANPVRFEGYEANADQLAVTEVNGQEVDAATQAAIQTAVNAVEATVSITYEYYINDALYKSAVVEQNPGSAPAAPAQDYITNFSYEVTSVGTSDCTVRVNCSENLPFIVTTDLNNAKWYAWRMHSNQPKFLSYSIDNSKVAYADKTTEDYSILTDNAYFWCITGNLVDGFKLYNKAVGTTQSLSYASDNPVMSTEDASNTWKLVKSTANSNWFCLQRADMSSGNKYVNLDLSRGLLAYWEDPDAGSSIYLHTPASFPVNYVAGYIKAPANAVGSSNYLNENEAIKTDAIAKLATAQADELNFTAAQELAEVANNIANGSFVAMAPGYYRIYNAQPGLYARNRGLIYDSNNMRWNEVTKQNVNNIVKLEAATSTEDAGKYYLYACNAKKYMQGVLGALGETTGTNSGITVTPLGSAQYNLVFGNGTMHANNHGDGSGMGSNLVSWDDNANSASAWYIEPASDLEVALNTVGEASYASAYLPFPVQGSGIYTGAINAEKTAIEMTEQTGVIPAETGIVIKGAKDATSTTLTIGGIVSADVTGNSLRGTLTALTENLSNYLVLGMGNTSNGIGFFAPSSSLSTIAANKAFILASDVTGISPAIAMNFGGETTGVGTVITENGIQSNAPVFDLSGRRVMQTVKGGLYIQNGKKFIVK